MLLQPMPVLLLLLLLPSFWFEGTHFSVVYCCIFFTLRPPQLYCTLLSLPKCLSLMTKTKNNGMELCFVVVMCLGTLANGQACVPCGCKYQRYWVGNQEAVDAGDPVPGAGDFASMWATFHNCSEALHRGKPTSEVGVCGVDRATNFCAGCVITMNAGVEEVQPNYAIPECRSLWGPH